jgi:hypothetical protein
MHVRIVEIPPGEAPIKIRKSWVGLVLPLSPGETGPRQFMTQGVLTGPRSFLGYLLARLLGRFKAENGFRVDAVGAVHVLAKHDAHAATWWRTHVPRCLQPGAAFIFHAEACHLVEAPPVVVVTTAPDDANPGGPFTSDLN